MATELLIFQQAANSAQAEDPPAPAETNNILSPDFTDPISSRWPRAMPTLAPENHTEITFLVIICLFAGFEYAYHP